MSIQREKRIGREPRSSEITPERVFSEPSGSRRKFLAAAGYSSAAAAAGYLTARQIPGLLTGPKVVKAAENNLSTVPSKYALADPQTPAAKASAYNNFFEFGTSKSDPSQNAHTLRTRPWTIKVSGMVAKPQTVDIDSLMHYRPIESRVYRHRCVEAWSMVIPWDGYSLSEFIAFCRPLPSAKYVQFLTLLDRHQMPDLPGGYDWPYSEGLRLDEAMHPLTLLTFGSYGSVLPNQNGAPVRIVIPWKYGFKSIKSIVEVHFTDRQPKTLWNEISSNEYGFYSNVNPEVDHPRWSQARERRIDSSAFPHTVSTQMFNGYADQVANMYSGMDLRKDF